MLYNIAQKRYLAPDLSQNTTDHSMRSYHWDCALNDVTHEMIFPGVLFSTAKYIYINIQIYDLKNAWAVEVPSDLLTCTLSYYDKRGVKQQQTMSNQTYNPIPSTLIDFSKDVSFTLYYKRASNTDPSSISIDFLFRLTTRNNGS